MKLTGYRYNFITSQFCNLNITVVNTYDMYRYEKVVKGVERTVVGADSPFLPRKVIWNGR